MCTKNVYTIEKICATVAIQSRKDDASIQILICGHPKSAISKYTYCKDMNMKINSEDREGFSFFWQLYTLLYRQYDESDTDARGVKDGTRDSK